MPKNPYEPIRLTRTNRYPGYQFHALVRVEGMDGFSAFRFLALTVFAWMLERIPAEDREAAELQLPPPENYGEVAAEAFLPYHFSVGYALDITPLMGSGIWSLRLKEPDSGLEGVRDAVAGRFFTTRVGLRLDEDGAVELGVQIDVTDPASAEKEVDFAFRPAFVRSLAVQPAVSFSDIREFRYGVPDVVDSEESYRRLLSMLDNEDNQMPLVVFTHVRPEEKKSVPAMSIEEFVKSDPLSSFSQFSAFRKPEKNMDFSVDTSGISFPGIKPGVAVTVTKKKVLQTELSAAAAAGPGQVVPAGSVEPEPPFLPYDAVRFSKSAFAYARTYVLGDSYKERFSGRIRKEFAPGDILVCGARKFRGSVSVFPYPGKKEEELKKTYDSVLLCAQSYSKHKSPYSFGKVVFEAEARKLEQHLRYREIVESTRYAEKEKVDQLMYQMDLLFEAVDNKDEDIRALKDQANENYERGRAFAEKEYDELEEENSSLRRELAERDQQIEVMRNSYLQAKDILDSVEPMRQTESLPSTNEEVVRYFCRMFGDRMDFTNRGLVSVYKCGISPANLWEILYTVANGLTDVFREKQDNLTEEDVMNATGFDMSFREGSMTREQKEYMKLRQDVYEGMEISIEPHIKLKAGKGVPAHQRLHFCYLPEFRRVVIGYLGDHLDSAATRYAKKR